MNARTRTARAALRQRSAQTRAAARIHRGPASLTTHGIAAGLTPREARTVAGALRNAATRLGITGTPARVHAARRMRDCRRYTTAQVALLAVNYRPRKPAYKAAVARLALAA
ncbi:hypothetical protein ACWGCW_00660 [Streptomyces sp. NPDC054933]